MPACFFYFVGPRFFFVARAVLVFVLLQNTGPALPLAYETYEKEKERSAFFEVHCCVTLRSSLFSRKKSTLQGVLVLQLGCVLSASRLPLCLYMRTYD